MLVRLESASGVLPRTRKGAGRGQVGLQAVPGKCRPGRHGPLLGEARARARLCPARNSAMPAASSPALSAVWQTPSWSVERGLGDVTQIRGLGPLNPALNPHLDPMQGAWLDAGTMHARLQPQRCRVLARAPSMVWQSSTVASTRILSDA